MSAVYVHGGVSATEAPRHSLARAIEVAVTKATALDAVEAAVRVLEDDPALNAGYGAVLTRDGLLELDAGIADGASERAAGVAGIAIRHPITMARRVLERTPHVLIVGQGAARLAADLGLEPLTETTPEQHESWREATARGLHHETVGAVALDENGNLCAASSTGGVFGKMSGRVGDSPVFGAGIYASAKAAAVGTGIGENFLQSLACARVGRLIEDGVDSQSACEETIELLQVRFRGEGGVLALDSEGRVGASYTGASWDVEGPTGSVQAARRARR